MKAVGRNWRLIAGVVLLLVVLVGVGRLQGQHLGGGRLGPSATTVGSVGGYAASGLAVAGRVRLPGPAVAVAVGHGAVWVLLEHGTLLRVDPGRYRVTGSVELGASTGGMPPGPLAVGAGAVWAGTREATVTARIDPVTLRVTGWFHGQVAMVAHGLLWSYCCRQGENPTGYGRADARTLAPRPPLVIKDAAGRRHPVGPLAVGADAVWTHVFQGERVWRVPLAGGPARAVARVSGFVYGLAADESGVWALSGAGDPPDDERDRTGRLRRLDQGTARVTVTIPLPDLAPGRAVGPVVGDGAVWLAGRYTRLLDGGGILLRVDPASGRVTGWFRSPVGFVQGVLAAGPHGAWIGSTAVGTAAPELLHLTPT